MNSISGCLNFSCFFLDGNVLVIKKIKILHIFINGQMLDFWEFIKNPEKFSADLIKFPVKGR